MSQFKHDGTKMGVLKFIIKDVCHSFWVFIIQSGDYRWQRKSLGGKWYLVYFPHHWGHDAYQEWTRDEELIKFPFHGQTLAIEEYPQK